METRNRFYFTVAVTMLVVILLPRGATVSAIRALTGGTPTFAEHSIADDFYKPGSVYAIDIDGDGDVDVLGAAYWDDIITWWENDGSENFTEHTIADSSASSVYATDIDRDGDVDVLGAGKYPGDITWWENDRSKNFTKHVITDDFKGAESVYAIDLDSDGDIDVLGVAYQPSASYADDVVWWENDGSENFTEHTITNSFNIPNSVYATDINRDGEVDIIVGAGSFDNGIAWWENDGNENFTEHTIDDNVCSAESVYAIDFDGDEDMDVLGADHCYDNISWWENDGSESFTKHIIADSLDYASSVFAADIDGDGDLDVLGTADFYHDDLNWWENDGSENFTKHIITDGFDGANSVYATDVDGDGDLDVLGAAYYDNNITWWEQYIIYRLYLPVVLKNAGPPSSPPVLNDISNPDGAPNFTVSWSSVSKATRYVLQEDDNASFSSPITVYSGPNTSTSVTVGDVGMYHYRVQATNSLGSGPWSNVVSVQVTQSPTPTPTPEPQTWVNVINHCSCTVFIDFEGPETESATVFANSTGVVFLIPGTYYYEIDSFGCGSGSGFVTIPDTVQFDFHIYCTSSMAATYPCETGQERTNCEAIVRPLNSEL